MTIKRSIILVFLFSVLFLNVTDFSYAKNTKKLTPFENYCLSFNNNLNEANQLLERYKNHTFLLQNHEKNVGSLSDNDYEDIEKCINERNETNQKIVFQLQVLNDLGKSISSDGLYVSTKKKIKGFDPITYTGLQVNANLTALDKKFSEIRNIKIDEKLLKRPNKPFNKTVSDIIGLIENNINLIKTDVSINDYINGKRNVDSANAVLKNADLAKDAIKKGLNSEPNDIQIYQLNLIQDDLMKVIEKLPMKQFNKVANDNIVTAEKYINLIKTDVSINDYINRKRNVDLANAVLKNADLAKDAIKKGFNSEPNDIQIYQLNLIQDDLIKAIEKLPVKQFSKVANDNIISAENCINAAKSDVSAKNYTKGQQNVDLANEAIKRALNASPNEIQQKQINDLQNELSSVSSDVKIGRNLDKVGNTILNLFGR